MTPVPFSILRAITEFSETNEYVPYWERYPHIPPEIDETLPACFTLSEQFTRFARDHDLDAVTIEASHALDELVDIHRWTRVSDGETLFNVDWTARQFHNLHWPPAPEHQDLPCPLVWDGEEHRLVRFAIIAEVTSENDWIPVQLIGPEEGRRSDL